MEIENSRQTRKSAVANKVRIKSGSRYPFSRPVEERNLMGPFLKNFVMPKLAAKRDKENVVKNLTLLLASNSMYSLSSDKPPAKIPKARKRREDMKIH